MQITLLKTKCELNPFKFLFETRQHPHARTLRTSFFTKLKDTFWVLNGYSNSADIRRSGDEINLGLFDYVTLCIPKIVFVMCWRLMYKIAQRSIPLAVIFGLIIAPLWLIGPLLSFLGTIASIPFVMMVQAITFGMKKLNGYDDFLLLEGSTNHQFKADGINQPYRHTFTQKKFQDWLRKDISDISISCRSSNPENKNTCWAAMFENHHSSHTYETTEDDITLRATEPVYDAGQADNKDGAFLLSFSPSNINHRKILKDMWIQNIGGICSTYEKQHLNKDASDECGEDDSVDFPAKFGLV